MLCSTGFAGMNVVVVPAGTAFAAGLHIVTVAWLSVIDLSMRSPTLKVIYLPPILQSASQRGKALCKGYMSDVSC